MRSIKHPTAALAVAAFLTSTLLAPQAWARASGTDKTMKMVDTDHDGTIDLNEAKAAAGATFDKLDTDKDGTVDTKELKGRLSRADLKAADTNMDGKLSKEEFLANVNGRFNLSDPDNDGKLDAKELRSPAGKKLMQLLK